MTDQPSNAEGQTTVSYLNQIVQLISIVKQKVDDLEGRLDQNEPPKRKGLFKSSLSEKPARKCPHSSYKPRIRFMPCVGYWKSRSADNASRRSNRSSKCSCPGSRGTRIVTSLIKASPEKTPTKELDFKETPFNSEKPPANASIQSFFTDLVRTKPMEAIQEPSNDILASDNGKCMVLNSVILVPTERGSLKVVTHSENCQCGLCKAVLASNTRHYKYSDDTACVIQKKLMRIPTSKGFKTLVTHFENCRCSLCLRLNNSERPIDDKLQIEHHDDLCSCGICQTVKSKQRRNRVLFPGSGVEIVVENALGSALVSQSDEELERERHTNNFIRRYLNNFSVFSYSQHSYADRRKAGFLSPVSDGLKKIHNKKRAAFKIRSTRSSRAAKASSTPKMKKSRAGENPSPDSNGNALITDVCMFHSRLDKKKKVLVELRGSSKKSKGNPTESQLSSFVFKGEMTGGQYSSIFKPSDRSLRDCATPVKAKPDEKSGGEREGGSDPAVTKGLLRALGRKKCGCTVCRQ